MPFVLEGRQPAGAVALRRRRPQGGRREPGYGYTESLKDSGVTWDEATLDKWIADPGAVIPGNGMSPPYGGVADPAIRKRIIAYLKTISPQDAAATDDAARPANATAAEDGRRLKFTEIDDVR